MTVAYLEVLDGPGDLREIEGRLTIGRGRAADLVLADDSVSRSHAAVWTEGSTVVVEDLDSSNGTWVNGERLGTARRAAHGDVIQVGTVRLKVRIEDSEDHVSSPTTPTVIHRPGDEAAV